MKHVFAMAQENNNNFPMKIVDVEPKVAEDLLKLFTGEHTGFVQVGPKGYFLPHKYREEASHIYNLPLRSDDIFVASYPRSGTTWTQELVWMVANGLAYVTAEEVPLAERYTFLEFSVFVHPLTEEKFKSENSHSEENLKLIKTLSQRGVELLEATTSQRFIKTHLPMSLLPPELLDKAKTVYVARDPRDVAVSFYHLIRLNRIHGYIGDFKTFWDYFKRDMQFWAPFFDHIKEAWEKRHHPNMLFLFYEDLSKDLPAAVRRVAKFFDKQFTPEQIDKLCDHLSIDNFKKNKSINFDILKEIGIFSSGEQNFIRKGKAGGWRDYFDADMAQEAENWMSKNLQDTDFRFPHLQTQ